MKISRNEQGEIVIEAIGTNDLEDGVERVVYPPINGIESGVIRMTIEPSAAFAIAVRRALEPVALDQDGKTAEERLEESEKELKIRNRELGYSKMRIDQLCGQIDAIDQEIYGYPVVTDVNDRSHPQWNMSLKKARELRESKRLTEVQNEELKAKIEWWIQRSALDDSRARVIDERLARVMDIANADRFLVGEPDGEAACVRSIQKELLAAMYGGTEMPCNRGLDGMWMQTCRGNAFWPTAPTPDDIDIIDIAHSLSNTCRFAGHTKSFYSVAQHCVLASQIVPPEDARWALLHDAAEAYIGDMVRPIKHSPMAGWFRRMEANIMRCVCDRFELPYEQPKSVDEADLRMLGTERRDLMTDPPRPWKWDGEPMDAKIVPWLPDEAKQKFLLRAMQLGIKIDTEEENHAE